MRLTTSWNRVEPFLERHRWVAALAATALGFGVAALERFRPDAVEALRLPVARVAAVYLTPLREGSREIDRTLDRARTLWGVQEETAALREKTIRLEAELQIAREEIRRLGRVSGLRNWRSPSELEFVSADVIGFTTEDRAALLTIDRGSADGVEEGLPVVGRDGLAGVVREVAPRSARVQALSDPLGAVGVADLRTRHRGMVVGEGRGLPLKFIPENEVQPFDRGSTLITSGFGNSLYPKGLVVGRIVERTTDKRGFVYGVVEPAENFSALEEVLVIRPASHAVVAPPPDLEPAGPEAPGEGEATDGGATRRPMGEFEVEMPASEGLPPDPPPDAIPTPASPDELRPVMPTSSPSPTPSLTPTPGPSPSPTVSPSPTPSPEPTESYREKFARRRERTTSATPDPSAAPDPSATPAAPSATDGEAEP